MVRTALITTALITTALIVASALSGHAMDTREGIFMPKFRTLKVRNVDNFDAMPVIRMGTEDRVEITFDELGDDNSWLEYRLVHCNADWQPSRLLDSEFTDGFNAVKIVDFAQSAATYVHYVNYRIEIPNEQTHLLQSGNYLLQVYDPDEPDNVILQARFQVSENYATVAGIYNARTDRGYNDRYQQLSLAVTADLSDGSNPYQDYKLEIRRNIGDMPVREISVPSRVNGNELIYAHDPQLIFPAGNEYRRFESVSNSFPGMNVDSLKYMGSNYHVWLRPDELRDDAEYVFDRTQHGRYIVREYNATDSNLGADYITVHFMLKADEMPGMEVYVDGEMTHGRYDKSNRMTYSAADGAYVLEMPLKQGAYNYRYVARDSDGNIRELDGDKWQTMNQYWVNVWQRRPGQRADRLIGVDVISDQ